MTYRRDAAGMEAARRWAAFVEANQPAIAQAGLPALAIQSVEHWDDLLMHGVFAYHVDPSHFGIGSLSEPQYAAYAQVADSYFASGYEFYAPMALRTADRERLLARYGHP